MTYAEKAERKSGSSVTHSWKHLSFLMRNFRKQWAIFYRSNYGKVGFYLLLSFVIISLLSPVIEIHSPMGFFAPSVDSYVATQDMSAHVIPSGTFTGVPYAPSASMLGSSGSYLLYVGTPKGQVYGVGMGGSSTTGEGTSYLLANITVPSGSIAFSPSVFPLSSYQAFVSSGETRLSYSNFLLYGYYGNRSALYVSEVGWSGSLPGEGRPFLFRNESFSLNSRILVPPVSSSISSSTPLPTWVQFDNAAAGALGLAYGTVYALSSNSTGIYLNAFSDYPLSSLWSSKLPLNVTPSAPEYVGSYYSPGDIHSSRLIIEQGNELMAFSPFTGRMLWTQGNFSTSLNERIGVLIPFNYQVGFSAETMAFVVAGNTLYGVYLSNGTVVTVYRTASPIDSVATTLGSSGFPTSIIVITSTHVRLVDGIGTLFHGGLLSRPLVYGSILYSPVYDPNTATFIITSTEGSLISVSSTGGKYAYNWHADYDAGVATSSPVLIANSRTGRFSVAILNAAGNLALYSTTGTDANPLPPTLHAPSGNVYLFGTNIYGQDVWSQWVASFPVDLEIGLLVALGTIIISILVAMVVGYLGGFVGSSLEVISLVIFLIPFIPLVIIMASILGDKSILNIALVFIAVGWPFTTFSLIGVVKSIKSRTFIEAAKVSGAGTLQIMRRHMLSNMTPLLAYFTALGIGGAVGGISGLQILGIGPLSIPTWGAMLGPFYANFFLVARAIWWLLPPTITLTVFIFAFVFVSRGLDEVVNPRLRRR